ncbi:multidrug effflux MFS transporter [Haematobacter missouriensis]|uniref:Bcr/CflA family efflux transporter n=1 Tax=Haematobacter missouriensis TaxID=366616 RepID=A0A212AJL5_9RHOB|nr:multidrug effflux MFS transporter [Haematobacter missouriensis]OWJ81667.1 Bcr/CflA family drug resistance efflux transporter [Haematobacter missouriensis]
MTATFPPPRSTTRFLDRKSPPHIGTLIFMAALPALTTNIFLPSLPTMARHFNTDYHVVQLGVSLFLVANAVLQLAIGPISDRFGRRPVLLASVAGYLVATLGVMLAPTVELFLAFRMLQAVIVAGMVLSRAIIRDTHPPERSAAMIGYVTLGMSIAPMIGPTLGGLLDQTFGWRASFTLLLIAGGALLALAWADLGETAPLRSHGGFRQQFRAYPALLSSRRFWGFCLAATFSSGVWFAYVGGAPLVASDLYGLTPMQLGVGFICPAVGYALGNFLSGRLSLRFGIERMVVFGNVVCMLFALALLALEVSGLLSVTLFFGMIAGVGVGNGLTMPNAMAGMLSVRPELAGSASGLGGAVTLGGGAACAALAAYLLGSGESGAIPLLLFMSVIGLLGLPPLLWLRR